MKKVLISFESFAGSFPLRFAEVEHIGIPRVSVSFTTVLWLLNLNAINPVGPKSHFGVRDEDETSHV